MPRNRQRQETRNNYLWVWVVVLAALVIAAYFVFVTYQKRQTEEQQPAAATQTGDVLADEGMVFGGEPRAQASAGGEASFEVLKNSAYVVGYSEGRKDPLWVAYHLMHRDHPYELPRPAGFHPDLRTSAHVKESDFSRTGYQRGHMAPNSSIARCFGADAQLETFLLSNVCPQSPPLNEHVWERLEVKEREYADSCQEVWVIDGPIFSDLNGGSTPQLASGIAVPTAFFKILIDEEGHSGGKPRIFSVIMPQDVKGTELPQEFLTSVGEIEKETHLEFFWKLDSATKAELEGKAFGMW
jgi:endonuclease G, mitochondrial